MSKISFTKGYRNGTDSKLDPYRVKGKGIRCPDYEILDDFYYGRLIFEDFFKVFCHIAECDNCTDIIESIEIGEKISKGQGPIPDTEPPKELPPKLADYLKNLKK